MKRILMVLVITLSFIGTAFAIPCTQGGVSGTVTPDGCFDGTGNNDFFNPLAVNEQEFFGFDDWQWLQKYEPPEDDKDASLATNFDYGWTITPDDGWADDSGTWSFLSSVWDDFTDVMIVLKNGNNDDVYFSGYLLDNETMPTSGTWATGDRDISHLTLYGRGEGAPVPEPSTLLLLGTGLVGLAYLRKRNKN